MPEQQKARCKAPRYNNRHRHLTPEQQAAFEAEGRQPVIRFKIENDRCQRLNMSSVDAKV